MSEKRKLCEIMDAAMANGMRTLSVEEGIEVLHYIQTLPKAAQQERFNEILIAQPTEADSSLHRTPRPSLSN
jgi:hypothetical protein